MMRRKVLSVLLAMVLVFASVDFPVFAAEEPADIETVAEQETERVAAVSTDWNDGTEDNSKEKQEETTKVNEQESEKTIEENESSETIPEIEKTTVENVETQLENESSETISETERTSEATEETTIENAETQLEDESRDTVAETEETTMENVETQLEDESSSTVAETTIENVETQPENESSDVISETEETTIENAETQMEENESSETIPETEFEEMTFIEESKELETGYMLESEGQEIKIELLPELEMGIGQEENILLNVQPEDLDLGDIIWEVGNSHVVAVKDGLVFAFDEGETDITARIKETDIESKCHVIVKSIDSEIADFSFFASPRSIVYDGNGAVRFAKKHNDYDISRGLGRGECVYKTKEDPYAWWCAEFVSQCAINGGGLPSTIPKNIQRSCTKLRTYLNNSGWCTQYEVKVRSDGSIREEDFKGTIAVGDIILYYCPKGYNPHAVMFAGWKNGKMLAYAHNNRRNGEVMYYHKCNCGKTISLAHVMHFNGNTATSEAANILPNICIDSLIGGEGVINIEGWAFDSNDYSRDIKIEIYVGGDIGTGKLYTITKNNKSCPSVGQVFPGVKDMCGFKYSIPVTERGFQHVYIYAVDPQTGERIKDNNNNTNLIRNVTIASTLPNIHVDSLTGGEGVINIQGWAFDPDDYSKDIQIEIYVGGDIGTGSCYKVMANNAFADVKKYWPEAKDMCGFKYTIPVNERGFQHVYVYAVDAQYPEQKKLENNNDTGLIRNVTIGSIANSIKFGSSSVSLKPNETASISCTFTGDGVRNLGWSPSGSSIVQLIDMKNYHYNYGKGSCTLNIKGLKAGTEKLYIHLMNADNESFFNQPLSVTVAQPVTGVSLNKTSLKLVEGKTGNLTASVTPSNASNKRITWSSSNTSVAAVSSSGTVTARSAGTAVITAAAADGSGYKARCTVTVEPYVSPAIEFDCSGHVIVDGEIVDNIINRNHMVSVDINFQGNGIETIKYSLDDPSLVKSAWHRLDYTTGNTKGTGCIFLKGLKPGDVTLTIHLLDSDSKEIYSESIKFYVRVLVHDIVFNKNTYTLTVGQTDSLQVSIIPEDTIGDPVSWKSSDENIVTVKEGGIITAKSVGTAKITAHANGQFGGIDSTCTVTVVADSTDTVDNKKLESMMSAIPASIEVEEGRAAKIAELPYKELGSGFSWDSPMSADTSIATSEIKQPTSSPYLEVTGKKAGTTKITINCKKSGTIVYSKEIVVKVTPKVIPVTAIKLDKSSISLKVGETEPIEALIVPSNATDKDLVWKSTNESVACVIDGTVRGLKAGSASIWAETADGSVSSAKISVDVLGTSTLYFNVNEIKLSVGDKINIDDKLVFESGLPSGYFSIIDLVSSAPDIVEVSDGTDILAKKAGTAILTASLDGKTTDTCKITVTQNYGDILEEDISPDWTEIPTGVWIACPTKSAFYTGKAIKPEVRVYDGSRMLVKDEDYTLSYTDNINAGTATVTAKGKGSYAFEINTTFTIEGRTIEDASIRLEQPQYIYTGKEIKPQVTVAYSGEKLQPDKDYTVEYMDNIEVGKGKAVVHGKGYYFGEAEVEFDIIFKLVTTVITLPDKVCIGVGEQYQVPITVTNESSEDVEVEVFWYTEDTDIIEVDFKTGLVTAKSEGKAVLYAESGNGYASCAVEVLGTVEKLTVPTASTASGSTVKSGTKVKLASKEDAQIYYTLDGSTPTVSSILFTEDITITKPVVIKAIAVKDKYKDSDIATFIYDVSDDTSARKINVNTEYADALADSSDEKMYKAVISDAGYISISFRHGYVDSGWNYWSAFIYDANMKELARYSYNARTISTVKDGNIGVPAGIYYIKVTNEGTNYSKEDYTIKLDYTASSEWETEFNEKHSDADWITVNTDVKGSLRKQDDIDWYKAEITGNGYISLYFIHDYVDSKWNYWSAYIYDANLEELAAYVYKGSTITAVQNGNIGVPAGIYYIKVTNEGTNHEDVDYTIRLNYTASNEWETEFNEKHSDADWITVNTDMKGSLRKQDDIDWYKTEITENGYISLDFVHEYVDSEWNYWSAYIYDANLEELAAYVYKGNTITAVQNGNIGVPAGIYYIKVTNEGTNHGDVDYTIRLNYTASSEWETEFNEKHLDADEIAVNTAMKGSIRKRDDIDWYKVDIFGSGNISLSFAHEYVDSEWNYWSTYIYDASLKELARNSYIGSAIKAVQSDNVKVETGTYYIKVTNEGTNHSDADYTITINTDAGITQTYKVAFDVQGYGIAPETCFVTKGSKIEKPADPQFSGATFEGWYIDANYTTAWNFDTDIVTGNITLYAKWSGMSEEPQQQYTVIFDSDGGTAVKPQSIQENATVTEPAAPIKEGYVFTGWYVNDVLYDFDTPVISNITLKAGWAEEGRVATPSPSIASGSKVKAGTKLKLKSDEGARIYYTLDGTIPTISSILYTGDIEITGDMTIKAVAVKDGYKNSDIVVLTYTIGGNSEDTGDDKPDNNETGNVLPDDIPSDGKIPSGLWIAGISDNGYMYTGKAVKPSVRVYDHNIRLVEKRDYTISYKNNVEANDAANESKAPSVVVKAKGNYTGTETATFKILAKDINTAGFDVIDIAAEPNGKVQKPVPVLTYNGKKLSSRKDFNLEYPDKSAGAYQEKGTYPIKITGKGNYTGEKTINFSITDVNLISKAKTSKISNQQYTGDALTPDIEVKYGKIILNEGIDYELEYRNNTEIGTASLVIKGIGSYCGQKSVPFKITGLAINKAQVTGLSTPSSYTGDKIVKNCNLMVSVNGSKIVLKQGLDYTVVFQNNVKAGKATVLFTGINGYSGTLKKIFKIDAYDIAANAGNKISCPKEMTISYSKGGSCPIPEIFFGKTKLVNGSDYTLAYKNNKAVTSGSRATVLVKGKGNFKGTISIPFTITTQDMSNLTVAVNDKVYKNRANIFATAFKIKDINGKVLSAGKDYDKNSVTYTYVQDVALENGINKKAGDSVEKTDIIPVHTQIQVAVNAKSGGYYTGTAKGIYRIIKSDIKNAKVSISAQAYTGQPIVPAKSDISVSVGGVKLQEAEFEIVSCTNNIKKGKASITIKGVGNYGGTKTLKFTIKSKGFSWWWRK